MHKAYIFLCHIPKTLKIDEATLQEKLFGYRIKNGFTYLEVAKKIVLDKSTIAKFERNGGFKIETQEKIEKYFLNMN